MLPRSWLARFLLLMLFLWLSAEVGLRILTGESSRWNVLLGAAKQSDPVVQFRHKPHYHFVGGPVTNELGYVAPDGLTTHKDPGVLRIIYLGDSNTVTPYFGNYPEQVETLLEARGIEVETVNTAIPGYTTENARLLFETEVSHFDADQFFVYLGWNDLFHYGPEGFPFRKERAGYPLNPVQRFLTQVYSLRLLYAAEKLASRYEPTVDEPLTEKEQGLYDAYRPTHFYDNLHAILQLAKARYPNVAVMTLATISNADPTPDEMKKAHFPTGMSKNMRKLDRIVAYYNEAVRTVAREEGVPIVDFFALFDNHERRKLLRDSCHFSEPGAAVAAAAVSEEVLRHRP
jgi:lysophospholipase L1-like esterase